MTEPTGHGGFRDTSDEISLLAVAALMLRGRRTILSLALIGAIVGTGIAMLRPRIYTSSATFIPEETDAGNSGLARAASQFGISVPNARQGWGPPVYVEVLESRALLEPLALDTLTVAEQGGKRVAVADLFGVHASTAARRTDLAVRVLGSHIAATEDRTIGGVRLAVSTPWPSVSFNLADRLVRGVGRFNVERRKSQAAAERQFVDGLAAEAERALRVAEDGLQLFLQRNREIGGSPQLVFDRDRMQREVVLRQQIYTSLLQSREEARIREVRDTPVITVLEDPRVPVIGESRKVLLKAIVGALGGALLGLLLTFLGQGLAGARVAPNKAEREFFELLAAATPRFRARGDGRSKKRIWSAARDQT